MSTGNGIPAPRRCTVPPLGLGAILLGLATLPGCGDAPGDEEMSVIDRSVFVDTYVDLRIATLRTEGQVDPARKEAILSERGVTEEELLEFAEVHGRDASFMRDVWDEVEAKLDSARNTTVDDPGGRTDGRGDGGDSGPGKEEDAGSAGG